MTQHRGRTPTPRYGRTRAEVEAMTEEEVERVRSQVPDDPIPLPPDHLACEGCGIAVAVQPRPPEPPPLPRRPGDLVYPKPVRFARCPECQAVHEAADGYVTEHPLVARRMGDQVARECVESTLLGLAVIAQKPPPDLGLLLPRLLPAVGHSVRFRNPLGLTGDLCSPRPWSHVTVGQRASLRAAYAPVLKDRMALAEPPVAVRCPSGGCLLCGVHGIDRSAIEVRRRGGVEATATAVWRSVTSPTLTGHACPDCAEAIDAVGAVGSSAIGRAALAHLRRVSPRSPKADRLRALLDGGATLPAWAAQPPPRVPCAEPFQHLHLDRL